MKIEHIDIQGFGVIHGPPIALIPRINLFLGENEAGKSTLQQAILALLFGFYQGNRITPSERSVHERFRPWQAGPYGGSLNYALDSGRKFRIQRSFDTDDVPTSVIDLTTGRDITRELGLGRHGNVPVARSHFGMSIDVFVSTCFVDQAAILSIVAPQAVAEAIVSITDTATVDTSAAQAVARLEETISRQVGGPRARVRPLPIARERLERARDELRSLEQVQAAIQDSLARRDELERRCHEHREQQHRISYLLISKRLEEVETALRTLEKVDQDISTLDKEAETLKEYSTFPRELRDTVIAEKGRVGALSQQKDEQQRQWQKASPELDTVQEEIRRCHDDIGGMESARSFALEKEEAFNRLRFSREDSLSKLVSIRQQMKGLQDTLSDKRAARRLPKSALAGGLGFALVLGISLTLAGVGSVGIPLAAVIAVATLVSYFLVKRTPAVKGELNEIKRAAEDEQTHVAELEQNLMNLLQEVGIKTDGVESGIEIFKRRASAKKSLTHTEDKLQTLEERRKTLLSLRQQFEDSEYQVTEAKTALMQALRRAMIDAPSVDQGITLFEERYNKRLHLDNIQQTIRNLKDQRSALLGGQTGPMLTALRGHLEAQRTALLAAVPELSGATTERSLPELENEEARLGQQLNQAEQEITRLKTTVETTLSGHRPRSQIEEDLSQYENEVRRLEGFASALTLARDVLQKATEEVHRDFAPRLAQSLGRSLSVITRGRYDSAYVDPSDLAIRLRAPETGAIVGVDELSIGTQEQAYLLLRIELARMLSASRETLPLILDDPFVNFDDGRLHSMLQLLVDISKENQVLLFIKDTFILQWFRSNSEEGVIFKVNELLAPPTSTEVESSNSG
jgi:uncharacterized protein YhaN